MTRQKDLLDILIEHRFVASAEAEFLRRRYPRLRQLAAVLTSKGLVSEVALAKSFALLYQLPFIHLVGKQIGEKVLKIVPYQLASRYQMVAYEFSPVTNGHARLKIAVGQPAWLHLTGGGPLHQLARRASLTVELAITTPRDIAWALRAYHRENLKSEISNLKSRGNKTQIQPTRPAIASVNLKEIKIPYPVLAKFPKDVARKYRSVVFAAPTERHFKVAAVNPADPKLLEILRFLKERNEISIDLYQTDQYGFEKAMTGFEQKPARTIERFEGVASPLAPAATGAAIAKPVIPTGLYGEDENDLDKLLPKPPISVPDLNKLVESGFVPKLLAGIISMAVRQKASDIHIEPTEQDLRLRYRIDGVLQEVMTMPLKLQPPLISRIKILAKMKIDEQRIPQDGRFDAKVLTHDVDIRVSSLPTVHGEKAAMRLLDKSAASFTLEQIGLAGRNLKRVEDAIARPWGIVLVTGPTGSGKTTTLYAILRKLISAKVNIISLEDPVEYEIPGVNQTQVKPKIGFSFAEGLRSVLRQDPNIIMVGEVRDGETAALATHAALTGHLVLTSLHTNDAAGALPRLINMGIEPYLISSAINAIIAQRLARRLCRSCKAKATVPEQVIDQIRRELANIAEAKALPINLFKPVGCKECNDTGYSGRIGIFEVLTSSEAIEQATVSRQRADVIREIAIKEGMITVRQDGILKAIQGLTTYEEVLKITSQ